MQTRRRAEQAGQGDGFNLPLFPFCNYATLLAVAFVFIAMMFNPAERMTAIASLGTSVFFFVLASLKNKSA
ncbi:amino acid permease [Acetobacter malorum]|uniref:Amino acid permease n=1 Tax=Acetobacter malorum TaxID=178901 RepID=A0A177G7L6_9PROT|nr:amino acid permease [Acetobacter malorum]